MEGTDDLIRRRIEELAERLERAKADQEADPDGWDISQAADVARELADLADDAEAAGIDIRPRLSPAERREMFMLQARAARLARELPPE